ncbi:hypothetical protein HK104_006794 [Borealophlyctis nickersoniae]|nr:hypothetical protein HK104_006794 [Borealophlyctis nickersoniae]
MSPLNFSSYIDTDSLLLVAAVSRKEIYGVIDAAKKRSMSMVIGLSVAMGCVVSGVFIAVALPLMKLAKAMSVLTRLDFAMLEQSNILDANSLIWELYNVQVTFSTMVKAFAGGIKKNKEMVNRNAPATSQARSGTAAGGGNNVTGNTLSRGQASSRGGA